MASPVVVRFAVEGLDQVRSSLRTVEDALVRAERNAAQAAQQGARTRITEQDRAAREQVRAAERAQRETARASEQAARAMDRIRERSATYAGKLAKEQADQEIREGQKAAREAERQAQRLQQIRERSATMAGQLAKQQADEEIRAAERVSRERSRIASHLSGAAARGYATGSAINRQIAGGVVQTALTLGGGFSIADSLRDEQSARQAAALLSNNAYLPGTKVPTKLAGADPERADPQKLKLRAAEISRATGVSEADLLEAATLHVKRSSNIGAAMGGLEMFAKMSKATGADIRSIADTSGKLQRQNPNLSDKDANELMLGIIQSGKLGTITMDEMASVSAKITKSRAAYQGDMTKNQQVLLGLAQIAARSGDSASASATTVSNLAADSLKHADKINAMGGGKRITDAKTGKLVGPEDLIASVFEKSGGNIQKIQGMGFGARSIKLFQELLPAFEAAGGFQDVKKGVAGVRAEMAPVTGAKYDEKKLEADFKAVEATQQFERALMDLKQSLGSALLPEFEKLVPTLKDLAPQFVDVAKTGLPAFVEFIKGIAALVKGHQAEIQWLASHPMAAIVGAEVAKSLGPAVLGEAVKKLLLSQAGGQAAGGAAGGGLPGAAGGGTAKGGSPLAGGAVLAGMALSGLNTAETVGAATGAKNDAASKKAQILELAKTDPQAAKKMLDEATKGVSGTTGAEAYGALFSKGAAGINPTTLISQQLGEYATHKFGGKTDADRAREKLTAKELIDDQALKAAIAKALADGIKQGTANAVPNARGGAPAAAPLSSPQRGGVGQ